MSRIFDGLKRAEAALASKRTNDIAQAASVTAIAPNRDSTKPKERRKRVAAKLAVKVAAADLQNGDKKELLWTLNASRKGFYCVSSSQHYREGMWLRVVFPYDVAHEKLTMLEEDANVARLDRLPQGGLGLAIVLKQRADVAAPNKGANGFEASRDHERRLTIRHSFTASAVAMCMKTESRLQTRCSDLSLGGCYLDTMNPFPEGTRVRLQLSKGEKLVQTTAEVRTSHLGMGMGVTFFEPANEHVSILAGWLTLAG